MCALLSALTASAQKYSASWSSLSQYETPEWFKDAKFGMWAHWGFQSDPEAGNWYTRNFYFEDLWQYNFHKERYGDPAQYGVKELLRDWKAENWNPTELVHLYKSIGAKYFFTLGNFHDNVDLWDSEYQEWNCVNFGPKRDVVGTWAEAARAEGLPFGISFHAAHAWTWLEGSRKFDGLLQKEDGVGQWWEGYDPQMLYVQNHPLSQDGDKSWAIYGQWDWGAGANHPDAAFKQNFVDRTLDAIQKYNPDLLYFDDNVLPFYYCDEQPGLQIASTFYNKMAAEHEGRDEGIMLCKGLNSTQQECLTWDIERGIPATIQENYWQTCTCLGEWFYSRDRYDRGDYKSAQLVVQMLLDIISKNGNMLLSVPLRGDGTPDDKELAILSDLGDWMTLNGEGVFGTRPWKIFGEGPIADAADASGGTSFNEGTNYSAQDVRYVQKEGKVYASVLAWPSAPTFCFKSFSVASTYYSGRVSEVELLGYGPVSFEQDLLGLTVAVPSTHPSYIAPVYRITFEGGTPTVAETWQEMVTELETFTQAIAGEVAAGTGRYNEADYNNLLQALADAKALGASAASLDELRTAWSLFQQGTTDETVSQEPYQFRATDYVSTDNARAPQSAFSYDAETNTFTITAAGQNNIAFKMDMSHDNEYYFENTQHWFAIVAENVRTGANDSYTWWFNGYNHLNSTPADRTLTLTDGRVLLLWNLQTNTEINGNVDFSHRKIIIRSHGAAFIHAIGLTAANGNMATIHDLNYYAPYEVAAIYPESMSSMGYNAATLTSKYRSLTQPYINQMSGTQAEEYQQRLDNLSDEDYTTARALYLEAKYVVENQPTTFSRCTYTPTAEGLHAVFDDSYHVYLTLYADDIVRVYKSFNEDMSVKKSLSVVATPQTVSFEIEDGEQTTTLRTAALRIVLDHTTGCVTTYRADTDETLLVERSNKWNAQKDGPFDSYRIRADFQLDADEPIYGMGQIQDGQLDRRGTAVLLKQVNMKISIPFFQSPKGYALFWDNYSPTVFTDNASGTRFTSTGTEIDYYVMEGETSADVLSHLRTLTGKAAMPPLWTFGLYQSKERYASANETMGVVKKYRELGVPLDCVVQDWMYWGDGQYWNAMAFLNPEFSNYEEMMNTVHDNHAHLMISIWSNFGSQTDLARELRECGRLLPPETYPLNIAGAYAYDSYSPTARDLYWRHLYDGLVTKGIDAYWMDATEPEHTSTSETDYDYVSECGRTWRSLYNGYVLGAVSGVHDHHYQLAHKNDAFVKDKRVSILTRSGFIGMQRYAAQPWSADITASWETLAAQIPTALNLSACGIPYWNSDIGAFFTGGYGGVNDANWRRLYLRWTQFGTFTTMMRFHGTNTPREIYQFGSEHDGVGDYDCILKYIKLRYRLLPYLYSTAWQVTKNDRTFMEALPLAFSWDEACRTVTDEYMFGDALLVAPVVKDVATSRSVYLPKPTPNPSLKGGESEGKWVDFWTGEQYEGGQTLTAATPADIIPLFVKGGSILPWGPEVQYSTEKPWDDLEIRVYPGQNGSMVLYEDAFDGYDFEHGEYTEIPFTWDEESSTLTIGERQGSYPTMLETRQFRIVKVTNVSGYGDEASEVIHESVTYDGHEISVKLTAESVEKDWLEECTNYILNPSFEEDNRVLTKQTPKRWTTDINTEWWGVSQSNGWTDPPAPDGLFIFGVWDPKTTAKAVISQNIILPAGDYVLTVDMHASSHDGRNRLGNQRLFANENYARFADQVIVVGTSDDYPMQTLVLNFTQTEDNAPVNIGVTTDGAPSETWFKIDNFRLYRVHHPIPTGIERTKNLEKNAADGIYDLSGRHLLTIPTKGVCIVNGRKVCLK